MILYACIIGTIFLCPLGLIYGRSYLFNAGLYCGVAALIMLFVVGVTHLDGDIIVQEVNQEYYSLMYQLENNNGDDKLIERYNHRIERGREIQRDFMIGVFIPDIYDDFAIIDD